ncbi:NADH:ubiquinone oxidoreductase subunit 4 (chain M) [Microbacterium testaceum]|uniref:NADH:ubiquinone oxidoreductase subunit 4 (chain M) n=1 Tax=Microbacterium testaceum TaxID=2033 RepID=UPI00342F9FA9
MRPRWIALLSASVAVLVGVMTWVAIVAGMSVGNALGGLGREHAEALPEFAATDVFSVAADGTLTPRPDGRSSRVWSELLRVTTPEFAASEITEYQTGDDPDSDTLAYVETADDPTKWVFAANLAYDGDRDLLLVTLVHEYAHMLSLGEDDTDPSAIGCDTEWAGSGCLLPDSDLQRFADRFWAGYTDAPARGNVDADTAWDFFEAHEEDFVSDYAATNVSEDFAETFAAYVVEPDVDATDSVVARKFSFFDALPEYASARERIRAEFHLEWRTGQ